MAHLLVGLTGGLAGGKSTVAGWLAESEDFTVVDADRLVADSYRPGGPGTEILEDLIGPEALSEDGSIDKAVVAERVFGDPALREQLERRIHPMVRTRFAEIAAHEPNIAVLEATLLVEAGFVPDFDVVVTVEAPEEVRLGRAVARGMSQDQALARLAAQSDGLVRRAAAEIVLDNEGSLDDLRVQTDGLVEELRRRASETETL